MIRKRRGLTAVLAGGVLGAIALPAYSASFSTSRTVSSAKASRPLVASTININGAKNIYIVDGINNTLEVFDTSLWFVPAGDSQSVTISLDDNSLELGNIHFLDGINNTLQVLDTSQGFNFNPNPNSANAAATFENELAKTLLLDHVNQNLTLPSLSADLKTESGRLETSVDSRNIAALYAVDGFNNQLQIADDASDRSLGQITGIPASAIALLADFFAGPLTAEDVPVQELLSYLTTVPGGNGLSGETDTINFESVFSEIANGPFEGSESDLVAAIVSSTSGDSQDLGWLKWLDIRDTSSSAGQSTDDFELALQRQVAQAWEVESSLDITARSSENVYIVDGFNNHLQVVRTGDGTLFNSDGAPQLAPLPGSVYWVDGTNNVVQVADAGSTLFDVFGSFNEAYQWTWFDEQEGAPTVFNSATTFSLDSSGDDSSETPFWQNQVTDANAEFGDGNLSSDAFMSGMSMNGFDGGMGDQGIGDRSFPAGFELATLWDEVASETAQFVTAASIAPDPNSDAFRVSGINNRLDLFTADGRSVTLTNASAYATEGLAVDGSGNVYIINGINNRIRGLTPTDRFEPNPVSFKPAEQLASQVSVPEPSSAAALPIGVMMAWLLAFARQQNIQHKRTDTAG